MHFGIALMSPSYSTVYYQRENIYSENWKGQKLRICGALRPNFWILQFF